MRSSGRFRYKKIIAITLITILIVYTGLSIYGARAIMVIPRLELTDFPSPNLVYEDVVFSCRGDGINLKGWYFPGENDRVIIIVHGGYQNRVDDTVDTLGLAGGLVEKGYSVLLFDLRGRGESEGKGLALSYIDNDIGGAIDYLISSGYDNEDITILGFCSGAVASCIYASRNNVASLVLDGCFNDIPTMVRRQAEMEGIPGFLMTCFMPGLHVMTNLVYDYDLINPIDVVDDVSCPILFIHEQKDEIIFLEEAYRLYDASGNPADAFWEVNGAEHSQSFRDFPIEYVNKLDEFITESAGIVPDNR